jgi:hypothetical protein
MMLRLRFAACLLASCLVLPACGSGDSGSKPTDAGVPDAPNQPMVGGRLGAAIASAAAASSASAKSKAKGADGDQPPESGVFGPGEADKRQPKGAPPKIDMLGEGTDPKAQLALKPDGPEQKTTITVGMRLGQAVRLPSVEWALSIKPEKAKGDKPAEGAAPAPLRIAATVTGVSMPPQNGSPKELSDKIAKLKGAVVRWDFAPNGAATNHAVELPKDSGEGLELVVDALVETLSLMSAPLPSKPVGKDAFWIVADRGKTAIGLEVVRYRVFKVQSIENDTVTFAVELRQYAADQKLMVPDEQGKKSDMALEAFESQGKATVVWKADAFVAVRGDVSERVGAKLAGGPRGSGVATELTSTVGAAPTSAPASAPAKKP